MAYDKVVDSARLDGALTLTANALRTKLVNGSAQLAWDEVQGFEPSIIPLQPYIGSGTTFIPLSQFRTRLQDLTINSNFYDSPEVLQNYCDNLNNAVGATVATVYSRSRSVSNEAGNLYVTMFAARVDISPLEIKWATEVTA